MGLIGVDNDRVQPSLPESTVCWPLNMFMQHRRTFSTFPSGGKDDAYWRQLAKDDDALNNEYFSEEFGILSRRAGLDGVSQSFISMLLRARVLTHKHDYTIFGHPGAR